MTTPAELATLAGGLLVAGFPGEAIDAETVRVLAGGHRAGLIFFRRNVASVEAVHALCSEIVELTPNDPGPFIAVDQEGGRVKRLGAPALQLPPMRVLGDIGDPELTRRAGAAVGAELAAVGFNVDFAPVLDVDTNPDNPVIGDRSFSRDPRKVGALGGAFAAGLESAGVLACGKHFPGHGDTDRDSHFDLPVVRHSRERLEAMEFLPFRLAGGLVSSLMTAHVVYEALDPGVPATCSPRIVTDLLRHELGYQGLVFSDDLEMRALADHASIEESAIGAIRAGCDALLVCTNFELAERAHLAILLECERDAEFHALCVARKARVDAVRRRFPARPAANGGAVRQAMLAAGGAQVLAEIARRTAS